ncbi:MAG TPA: hypothetical protein VEI48_09710 [Candidatus Sulfotelmatobacter sp.]|nr:hypothetical protein [Candidatus Sulfotelmatobacter sp.]
MHRIKRGLSIGIALTALLALPASMFTADGYSQGATVKVTR